MFLRRKFIPTLIALSTTALLAACSSDSNDDDNTDYIEQDISISFMGHTGADHVMCGMTASNMGTGAASGMVTDFRVFVHDVTLIDEDGEEFIITQTDNDFQTARLTLLDFRDRSDCTQMSGETNPAYNSEVIGTFQAPEGTLISAIKFGVGVPFELNHANPLTADAPLNSSGMQWNWQGGYKHMRIEGKFDSQPYVFHLGSTGCDGEPQSGGTTACSNNNRPTITLTEFNPDMQAVVIDVQALTEDTELDADGGAKCHSQMDNAVCSEQFNALGLSHNGTTSNGQTVFSLAMKHN
jgi:uncharacterized repeat protein (TIGR04052 family)